VLYSYLADENLAWLFRLAGFDITDERVDEGLKLINEPPVADFTFSPIKPFVNENVTFNASTSYDPDGGIVSYEWDFGDGNNGTGVIITHSYASAGVYNVNLTVTDDDRAKDSIFKVITVSELEGTIFDTGTPANPYPSIMGNHTGTITPNQTITVQKLYTYPCRGTGGHTEYARIWNNTGFNATATWNGYKDDWHNISFDKTFTLVANETYNYTICTGSYPQIIHEMSFDAIGGTITCTEFIDANGHSYNNWIPAIRLE
jgi:PKD repeat protein